MSIRDDGTAHIADLKHMVAEFSRERDWEQFHSPKNLSMAISVEAAELLEILQWKSEEESQPSAFDSETLGRIQSEVADIAAFLLNFCNVVGIDLTTAMREKFAHNARKYPVDLVRGRAEKYNEYPSSRNE